MSKIKKDPSRAELGSSQVQGQGTTNKESGVEKSSSRHKQKK